MASMSMATVMQHVFPCFAPRTKRATMVIGAPTDVRHLDISECIPGLTEAQCEQIRSKTRSNATSLLDFAPDVLPYPPSLATRDISTRGSGSECEDSWGKSKSCLSLNDSLVNDAAKKSPGDVAPPPRVARKRSSMMELKMEDMVETEKQSRG
ncbi:hypothetical protein COCVIDRAFT_89896 [Bipolaris victoriae FI3]|uniref:Uncharacterized protein n=2 Tax=Bipolaris TaxID=33194 RepID=W6Y6Z7_COCC2|nr:uncharacterized protein COCCADRAFT_35090 [Bipolaris zeicola 26-R-13]XP_014560180.1 hypothetical protein COCVIDRAFT_89896 [Bipolaris victoriae FI3]EUC35357.1 hypothetical protein COCCADRAFT_35090 [Bipolaris zeicola 26-R-13]